MLSFILARAKEPSTYAGLAAIAVGFGLTEAQWLATSGVLAAIAGAVSVFLPEKTS